MKRKLFVILALTVFATLLICCGALADNELAFVQQPTVGTLDGDALVYPVT